MSDWRGSGAEQRAWFGAGSHAQAASLAGAIVERGLPLPDLDVRRDGVRVGRVGDSAAAVSAAARELGLVDDPSGLQELRFLVDSPEPAAVTGFWRRALDYGDLGDGAIGDRWRRCPVLRFRRAADPRPLRNHVHLDAGHPGPVGETVAALTAAGGRVRVATEWYSTVADADGNEVDVVPGGALGAEESTADWSVLFGGMAAYPGTTPRQAAELAAAAAGAADDAGIPLMIDVRAEGVVLDSYKDQWEVDGFLGLAAAVQDAARAAGLTADNRGLRFVQAGIDAVDVAAVREFWRAVLGYAPSPDPRLTDLFDPRQLGPVVFVQPMDAGETERRAQRKRIHVELLVPADQLPARVDTALAAGGRRLEADAPDRCRLADPEGNELLLRA